MCLRYLLIVAEHPCTGTHIVNGGTQVASKKQLHTNHVKLLFNKTYFVRYS